MRKLRIPAMALLAAVALASCSSRPAAVDRMVDELNSPAFRAKEAKTGLFDDSKAEIIENQLVITFLCRPFINLASIKPDDIPQLQASAIDEFRTNATADKKFHDGLQALQQAEMSIVMVWQDVNGATIRIPVSPADILSE